MEANSDYSKVLATFLDEARELMAQMEEILLSAEERGAGADDLAALFRCAHTIKGSAGVLGLEEVVRFTHVVEDVLDRLRYGVIGFSSELVGTLLGCQDHIDGMIAALAAGSVPDAAASDTLIARLSRWTAPVAAALPAPASAGAAVVGVWCISLRFAPQTYADGMDPLAFIVHLSTLGRIVGVETLTDRLPAFEAADPECCHLGFEVTLEAATTREDIEHVFQFVADSAQIVIVPPGRPEPVRQQNGTVPTAPREAAAKNLRVPSERLDALIDRVGELVIAGAGVQALAERCGQSGLQEAAAAATTLVEDIRDMALQLRMVPIGEVFARFPRVVRDVSKELGKDIELVISGAEAELDKSMVEKIADPLMHLIRNAMDHGIEDAGVRLARGKPVRGTVALNACHESGSIVVEVADDGGGLDAERIFAKAVEKGLVAADAKLAPEDIHRLILTPGFSTAAQVTNLSGRGVGMDVVKSNVEALRGALDIHSAAGRGTTVRLCLPLTLAIIDGFHIGVGDSHFVVPLDMVVECIELPADRDRLDYMGSRGEPLPFVRLRRLFGNQGPAHIRPRLVVVRFAGKRAGLVVDRIYGKCQTVIKPLGPLFAQAPCVSGSTILGGGEVALILDVAQLMEEVAARERRAIQAALAA